jgi:AcrR family transcriptional regulator
VSGTAKRLMDLAEAHIRESGYAGFSFRNLAAEVGIKSASVHHHFPTKAKMAAAVARRYGERFVASVVAKPGESADDAIAVYSIYVPGCTRARWADVPLWRPRSRGKRLGSGVAPITSWRRWRGE